MHDAIDKALDSAIAIAHMEQLLQDVAEATAKVFPGTDCVHARPWHWQPGSPDWLVEKSCKPGSPSPSTHSFAAQAAAGGG